VHRHAGVRRARLAACALQGGGVEHTALGGARPGGGKHRAPAHGLLLPGSVAGPVCRQADRADWRGSQQRPRVLAPRRAHACALPAQRERRPVVRHQ